MSCPRTPTYSEALACKVGNGALAGICGVTCSFPLDLVKTRFQLNKAEYKGKFVNAFKAVKAERGLLGLYGGMTVNLVCITPEKALKLVTNDLVRAKFTKADGSIEVKHEIIAGASAGFMQVFVTSPMEMFKIAGQTGIPLKEAYTQRTQGRGFLGLYTGYLSTLARDIPFSIVYFPLYANLKGVLTPAGEKPTSVQALMAGMISGLVSALMVTPMDCIKTRIQKSTGDKTLNYFVAGRQIYAEGGVPALFNGGLARGIVVGVLFAAAQIAYELALAEKVMGFR